MLITPNIANAAPAPPQAGNAARPADNAFAQLLNRQQAAPAEAAPEAAADDPTKPSAEADKADSARAAEARGARNRAATRSANGSNGKAGNDKKTETAESAAVKTDKADAQTADAAPVVDPALAHWLANLHLPPAVPAEAAQAGTAAALSSHGGKAVAALDTAAAGTTGSTDAEASSGLAGRKGLPVHGAGRPDDRTDKAGAPALRAAAEKSAASADALVATTTADNAAQQAPTAGPRGFEAAAAALTAGPTPAPVAAAPEPLTVVVPAALDSAEFAQAFGVQVSVLARDGVEHAELQLNPTEMGPVSVQIVMDGTQARIDFGADAAGTRQAIEHSLPDLAAALREAGLTLSGGGVSQHAHGRGNDTPGEQRPGAFAARGGDAQAPSAPAQRWRGSVSATGVDLYA